MNIGETQSFNRVRPSMLARVVFYFFAFQVLLGSLLGILRHLEVVTGVRGSLLDALSDTSPLLILPFIAVTVRRWKVGAAAALLLGLAAVADYSLGFGIAMALCGINVAVLIAWIRLVRVVPSAG